MQNLEASEGVGKTFKEVVRDTPINPSHGPCLMALMTHYRLCFVIKKVHSVIDRLLV